MKTYRFLTALLTALTFFSIVHGQPSSPFTMIESGSLSGAFSDVTYTSAIGYTFRFNLTGISGSLAPYLYVAKTYTSRDLPSKILLDVKMTPGSQGVLFFLCLLDNGGIGSGDVASVSSQSYVSAGDDWKTVALTVSSGNATFTRLRIKTSFFLGDIGTKEMLLRRIRLISAIGDTTILDSGGSLYANPAIVALGMAGTYGALSYAAITGSASVNGDVGSSTSAIDAGIVPTGTNWNIVDNVHNLTAQNDLATALGDVSGRANDLTIANALGGQILPRGVYSGGALDLASGATLTLSGSATDIFIIKAASTLTVNTNSNVVLTGGAVWSNVFWYVGSSATIFSGTTFNGNVLAVTSITLNASATLINARLLAHGGAVTINSNVLPVELTSFTAIANQTNADLHWSTATEVNNYGFEIERRLVNSQSWGKIGFVKGSGTSNITRSYNYTDANISSGTYAYRLKQIDNNGMYKYSSEAEIMVSAPKVFALNQNYPNPFNPSTSIKYEVSSITHVKLAVYDILGREVSVLVNEMKPAGEYKAIFNTYNLPSGTYFYRLTANNFVETKKMILMK